MPTGDKGKYTDKEKRHARHIEEGYEERGVPEDEAERRAWATVNAVHGGGEKPGGGGYGKPENHEPMRKAAEKVAGNNFTSAIRRDRMRMLGGLTWKGLAQRVWGEFKRDDIFGRAAQLAYYFLLALFPLLIFLTSSIGLIVGSGTGMRRTLFAYLSRVMPSSAFRLIDSTVWEISTASGAGKLSFGFLAALWAASNGMGAITQALNVAYNVEETRPWWKQRLVAVGLTAALSVLIILALFIVLGGSKLAELLASHYELSSVFTIVWKVLQWPIALGFMLLAFALIYFFAPDLHDQGWKWLTPGSAIGIALWLLVSFAFKGYLHFFDSYSKTYGSLGAVIVLMLWLYLTGLAVLIGGEVNSEIEDAAAKRGAPDAKLKGTKTPRESPKTAEVA